MKICIYGAGAIGGFVAALLARQGEAEVSVIARGPHLEAIRANGLTLEYDGETFTTPVTASDDPSAIGPQDVVVLTVKTTALPSVAPALGPLLRDDTTIVTAQNGIPWWFFHGFGDHDGKKLTTVDPDGVLAAAIPAERLVGCVLHIGCSVPAPGVIRHAAQNRFILGEPDGTESERASAISALFAAAGIGAEVSTAIQQETWIKLLGNMTFAPISLLTGGTNDQIADDPAIRQLCIHMMEDARRVGEAYGLEPGMPAGERVDLGGNLKGFRTSMLQDFDAGRPVELDSIVAAVIEMGDLAGEATPTIDAVYGLAAQKARLAGLYDYALESMD